MAPNLNIGTQADWRAAPEHADGIIGPDAVVPLLDGSQDVWLASCAGFYAMVGLVINAFEIPPQPGGPVLS